MSTAQFVLSNDDGNFIIKTSIMEKTFEQLSQSKDEILEMEKILLEDGEIDIYSGEILGVYFKETTSEEMEEKITFVKTFLKENGILTFGAKKGYKPDNLKYRLKYLEMLGAENIKKINEIFKG